MSEAHRNTRFEKWDLCNKKRASDEPSEDYKLKLHKYKRNQLDCHLLVGYKICTKIPHLQIFHRACASTIRDYATRLFYFYFLSFDSFLFSFHYFSFASYLLANKNYIN